MSKVMFYTSFLISVLYFTESSAQSNPNSYFPMETGNRWDYFITHQVHGGDIYYDTLSVLITGDTTINDNNYFVFSSPLFYDYNDDWRLLRMENDSLYCFNSAEQEDCLIFAFNQPQGSYYNCCRYDSILFYDQTYYSFFGVPDTQQNHSDYNTGFAFSKKFGIINLDQNLILQEFIYTLYGCIISGETFGELLTESESILEHKQGFQLYQNYPNPFNPQTTISFEIPKQSLIKLIIYDALGREVRCLVNNEMKEAGRYNINFNGENLPSGIYIFSLRAGGWLRNGKMTLIK